MTDDKFINIKYRSQVEWTERVKFKSYKLGIAYIFVMLIMLIFINPAYATSHTFQDFLFDACRNAQPGSDFDIRCNVDSNQGDLSGDSEDSLNPTQSLSNLSSALAETRARIKSLQIKMKQQREKNKASMSASEDQQSAMETFQMEGFSVLLNGENGKLTHQLTPLERGYDTDTVKIQGGVDFRLTDDWIIGAIVSIENYKTLFDADGAGRNFLPGNSEGSSDGDSVAVNILTTKNIDQSFYLDALLSYSWIDYSFSRVGLFQESSRTTPTIEVNTTANTSGKQLALALGAGWDHSSGAHNYQVFSRVSFQYSQIDGYAEKGGAGFAMRINDKSANETVLTLGLKYAYTINNSFGVLVPQLFVEYENLLKSDVQTTTSSFVSDNNQTQFSVQGDKIDRKYGRMGASMVSVLPNGWTFFLSASKVFAKDLIEQSRFNAGLRKEF
ncbi:MAG: hypothetical protein COB35_02255 [Gammaproteobacteria bacterium]|nr:MAG: hypothetical protein COB35_02255 [Gammaproteobacteria bacterium]